jgi:hypothetical protein
MPEHAEPEVFETVDPNADEPKKRKRRSEGRPHKRLAEPLLFKRKDDVRRKLEIHKAKCILLNERLELYEREVTLRTQPVQTPV